MIRLPIYNKDFLFNIGKDLTVNEDRPNPIWTSGLWIPKRCGNDISSDDIAKKELFRLLKYNTCPFCGEKMRDIAEYKDYGNSIFVCDNCLYWGGRGSRIDGPYSTRGILGRMEFTNNIEDVKLEQVLVYLKSNIEKIYDLSPREAEKLLPHILSDYLDCEVLAFGGVKDKGIDALAIHGDGVKMLIQIKWRKNQSKAESVSVVREVGGTMLARKIPKGFIVTTRNKFSIEAKKEAELISENVLYGLGKLELQLNDYNNLIDMFEISTKKRTKNMKLEDFTNGWDEYSLFG